MGKVINSTNIDSSALLKAKLPNNLQTDNYYLESLQHKINYEWEYRFNRFDIEEENSFGSEQYHPLEVIIDTVYDEKLKTELSNDWRKLIFRDIRHPLTLGQRFRFGINAWGKDISNENKSIWILANYNSFSPTAGCVVRRCDATLNMISEDGKDFHYEPCCFEDDFKAVNTWFDVSINTPQAQVCAIAQYNDYTKKIKINHRFIMGETDLDDSENNLVYRVKAVNKCRSKTTFNNKNVSFVVLALDLDSISPQDDLVNRIAFNAPIFHVIKNEESIEVPVEGPTVDTYELKIQQTNGKEFPEKIFLNDEIECQVICYKNNEQYNIPIEITLDLLKTTNDNYYYNFVDKGNGVFSIRNKKMYIKDKLEITCIAKDETTDEIKSQFYLQLGGVS